VLYTFDRADIKQIVVVDKHLAVSVVRGGEHDYPEGSILVAETCRPSGRATPSLIPAAA
jgi:hypothetical protein